MHISYLRWVRFPRAAAAMSTSAPKDARGNTGTGGEVVWYIAAEVELQNQQLRLQLRYHHL
ncbi:MAG: hypothetical protein ACRETP_00400 [Steroidobacteraceae bacterium]